MAIGTKQRVLSRLPRIGGQIDGIRRMVEQDRHGVDVIHLGDAVRKEQVGELMPGCSRCGHLRER